jgi:hypothetical protein
MNRKDINSLGLLGVFSAIGLIAICQVIIPIVLTVTVGIPFDNSVNNKLKVISDAPTVEKAITGLDEVATALEQRGMTKGDTSLFWEDPRNDVATFYNDYIIGSRDSLKASVGKDELTKTNTLLRVQKTLIDPGAGSTGGVTVTMPSGLWIYPYNKQYFWFEIGTFLFATLIGFVGLIFSEV